jgi:4-aminobutyrate aminotransferase-like enzyme
VSADAVLARLRRRAGGGPRPLAEAVGAVAGHGSGAFIRTTDGRQMLDAVCGYGVASLGHCHPEWVKAVTDQAARLTVSPLATTELADYLDALGNLLPHELGQIALHSTGAEAVEVAVRTAQTASGKPNVLTFTDGFHGKTAALRYTRDPLAPEATQLAPKWMLTAPYPCCEEHDAVSYPACAEPVEQLIEQLRSREDLAKVGTVLVEPVLGTAGNLPPRRAFLPALRRLCDDRGWLLIFDESITGFGRLGHLFGYETFGVQPDILVLSKGIAGGFPASAVCTSPQLWSASALGAPSATSSSYGANPLACAAAHATLKIVSNPEFLSHVRDVSQTSAQRIHDLQESRPEVARSRGIGLMLGFDLIDPSTGQFAAPDRCASVVRECRDRGVLVAAHVPRVRLNPPLTLSDKEAHRLFDVLSDALR